MSFAFGCIRHSPYSPLSSLQLEILHAKSKKIIMPRSLLSLGLWVSIQHQAAQPSYMRQRFSGLVACWIIHDTCCFTSSGTTAPFSCPSFSWSSSCSSRCCCAFFFIIIGDFAWIIESYLGIWRELLRVILEFSVAYWGYLGICAGYLGLFGGLAWIIWGYFSHFLDFLGDHDDNNRSGDTARVRVCGVFWSYFGVFGFWFPLRSIFGLF